MVKVGLGALQALPSWKLAECNTGAGEADLEFSKLAVTRGRSFTKVSQSKAGVRSGYSTCVRPDQLYAVTALANKRTGVMRTNELNKRTTKTLPEF